MPTGPGDSTATKAGEPDLDAMAAQVVAMDSTSQTRDPSEPSQQAPEGGEAAPAPTGDQPAPAPSGGGETPPAGKTLKDVYHTPMDMVSRGFLEGANDVSNFVVGGVKQVADKFGFGPKIFGDPEWHDIMATDTKDENPLQVPQSYIDRTFGRPQDTLDKAASFLGGLAATTAVGEGLPEVAVAGKVVAQTLKWGAAATATSDPRAERLSSALAAIPYLRPIASRLAVDPHDSEGVAMAKSAAENFFSVLSVEAALGAAKGAIKFVGSLTDGSHQAEFKVVPHPTEPNAFTVQPVGEAVGPTGEVPAKEVPVEGSPNAGTAAPEAAQAAPALTRGEAESAASSMEETNAQQRMANAGPPAELTDQQKTGVKALMDQLTDPLASKATITETIRQFKLRDAYMAGPEYQDKLVEHFENIAQSSSMSHQQIVDGAREVFNNEISSKDADILKGLKDAGPWIIARQALLRVQGAVATDLAQHIITGTGDNTIALANFGAIVDKALQTFTNLQQAGSSSGFNLGALSPWGKGAAAQLASDVSVRAEEEGVAASPSELSQLHQYLNELNGKAPQTPILPEDLKPLAHLIAASDGHPTEIYDAITGTLRQSLAGRILKDGTASTKTLSWAATVKRLPSDIFVGSILSGLFTVGRVALGTTIQALATTAEKFLTVGAEDLREMAGFRPAGSGAKAWTEAQTYLTDSFLHNAESFQMARKAFVQGGQSQLDPTLSSTHSDLYHEGVQWLQDLVHAPLRFHAAIGEFFRAKVYLAEVGSRSARQSMELKLNGAQTIAARDAALKSAVRPDGAATYKDLLDRANEVTFTQKPPDNSYAQFLGQYVNEHPWARIMAPVIRVPWNFMQRSIERMPLASRFLQSTQRAMDSGGIEASRAYAKITFGTSVVATAAHLTLAGKLTGRYSSDPKIRAQQIANGYPEYAYLHPDGTHTPLAPLGVPGMIARVGADLTNETSKIADDVKQTLAFQKLAEGEHPIITVTKRIADFIAVTGATSTRDGEDYLTAMVASISHSFANLSYMPDMIKWADALASGDQQKLKEQVRTLHEAAVPKLIQNFNQDPLIREHEGILQDMMNVTPWFSTKLEPSRNYFGEPRIKTPAYTDDPNFKENPFAGHVRIPEKVESVLAEIGKPIPPIPKVKNNNTGIRVDLTDRDRYREVGMSRQSPYDRWNELMSTELVSSKTLREGVTQLIQSSEFERAWNADHGEMIPGNKAFDMVYDKVQTYRNKGWTKVLAEYPKLSSVMKLENKLNAATRAGRTGPANDAIAGLLHQNEP